MHKFTWSISNFEIGGFSGYIHITDDLRFYFEENRGKIIRSFNDGMTVLVEGFVLLRSNKRQEVNGRDTILIIRELFKRFGDDLIHYIKGIFTIVIISDGNFRVFNDHLGISKFFYSRINEDRFLISNSIRILTKNLNARPDTESIGRYLLLNYFTGDATFFSSIKKSRPSEKIFYDGKLRNVKYWDYNTLFRGPDKSVDYRIIEEKLAGLLEYHLNEMGINRPVITLTGGLDSRLLLALLFKIGVCPAVMCYGNPSSGDVRVSRLLSERFGLDFINPFPAVNSAEDFDKTAEEIIRSGESLAGIYRAYRYLSIKRLIEISGQPDGLIGGYMGGEVVRGLHYERMIFSEPLYLIWKGAGVEKGLSGYFSRNHINPAIFNFARILEDLELSGLLPVNGAVKIAEFSIIFNIGAYLHHAQDINLFRSLGIHTYPLFLDIEYLELLFSSAYSFFYKTNFTTNQIKRIDIQEFHCNLISRLNPELAGINFNYGYSANLYLSNRLLYLAKRVIIKKLGKKPVPGFTYNKWYKEYLFSVLSSGRTGALNDFFDFTGMIAELTNESRYRSNEADFLPFTNAVNLLLILKNYGT